MPKILQQVTDVTRSNLKLSFLDDNRHEARWPKFSLAPPKRGCGAPLAGRSPATRVSPVDSWRYKTIARLPPGRDPCAGRARGYVCPAAVAHDHYTFWIGRRPEGRRVRCLEAERTYGRRAIVRDSSRRSRPQSRRSQHQSRRSLRRQGRGRVTRDAAPVTADTAIMGVTEVTGVTVVTATKVAVAASR